MEGNGKYRKAIVHLKKQDPVLADVIAKIPLLERRIVGSNYFLDLVETIISQQLSIKAADTIWGRFQALFPKKGITPEAVMQMDTERIRTAGISYQKISYIKDLATKTAESGIIFEQFEIMTDEKIITELVKVKGIGQWTAEMFLMFNMGRPDVFSYGDLGIRKAIQRLYNFKKEPTQKQADKISEKWRPYRTIACRYLWRSLEM
ncbi:MAG: DNA-3-methyladenine glycosylase 2 family protein [Candidatus Levybacteria bacterium]|nr:DNA-3-methyladenine glycosylase 2 family protein [Candidatus Levybacteria bacterium]